MNKKALEHFRKVDPVLYEIAQKVKAIELIVPSSKEDYFTNLCETIVGQQLSGKAADTIWGRVKKLLPEEKISPDQVLVQSEEQLRSCGVSWAKARYMRDLADKVKTGVVRLNKLDKLNDEEVILELTKIKGIGQWTAEMFLIFTLGRDDVFSAGDLGLKNAIAKLPGLQIPIIWSPYRSFASRVLWRSLEL